jgi:hypothetical protein
MTTIHTCTHSCKSFFNSTEEKVFRRVDIFIYFNETRLMKPGEGIYLFICNCFFFWGEYFFIIHISTDNLVH